MDRELLAVCERLGVVYTAQPEGGFRYASFWRDEGGLWCRVNVTPRVKKLLGLGLVEHDPWGDRLVGEVLVTATGLAWSRDGSERAGGRSLSEPLG